MSTSVIDCAIPGKVFNHHWNLCVGAGRAAEGLRAGWLEHLALTVDSCGFRYVRFHGLFHDDMFVWSAVGGRVAYNWQYVDEVFDRMLDLGARPFVELGFCPQDLATEVATVFWWKGHGSPPKDLGTWGELVAALIRHLLDRYGADEVRSWYFEVWNEPNLEPFFRGTRSQYFQLYASTVRAVKAIDPRLRVGGPATSNFVPDDRFAGEVEDRTRQLTWQVADLDSLRWKGVWIEEFLAYCAAERLPLDFLSAHPYPTDWALDGHGENRGRSRGRDAILHDLAWLRGVVSASAYPQAEIHCTEWSSSPSPRDFSHDDLPAATYVVRSNLRSIGLVDSLSYWVFTDVFEESGAGASIFHGGFGLVNFQGIPKPTYHAYRLLNRLGNRLLYEEEGLAITKHEDGAVSALLYHYPSEHPSSVPHTHARSESAAVRALGAPAGRTLVLTGLRPGAVYEIEILDETSGHALGIWAGMGFPEPPNRSQTVQLINAASALSRTRQQASHAGRLDLTMTLAPWAVALVDEVR